MLLKVFIPASIIIPTIFCAIYMMSCKTGKRISNIFFGILLINIAIITISTMMRYNHIFARYFAIAYIFDFFSLLLGPLIALYVLSFFKENFKLKPAYIVLFIPFVIVLSYILFKTHIDAQFGKRSNQIPFIAIEFIHNIIFFLSVLFFVFKNKIKLKKNFSNFREIKLLWIRFVYLFLLLIWIFKTIIALIYKLYYYNIFIFILVGLFYFSIITFLAIAIFFIVKKFQYIYPKDKYTFSSLSEEEKQNYYNKILEFFRDKKPYLDSGLSLFKLADMIEIRPKILSQIVNEKAQLHFNEFINRYRIEYSCSLLKDPKCEKNILEIMFESGFNSKTTFNTAFKRIMKTTPVEYRSNQISE